MVGAVFCIALSILPLLVVLIVCDGMIEGMTNRIVSLSSYDLQVVIASDTTDYADYEMTSRLIMEVPNVKSTVVERQGMALAGSREGRTGAMIRGVDVDLYEKNESFQKYLEVLEGKFDLSTKNSAVIGEKLASELKLKVGDTLRVISSSESNGKTHPRFASFKVKGIVSSGYQELDAHWIFIPVKTAFDLFSTSSSRIIIGVETTCPFDYELFQVQKEINQQIRRETTLLPTIYTWKNINSSKFENFASTKLLLVLIMSIIVLVSSVNVASSIVMLIMEKKKEIAILKSFGTSNSDIVFIFLLIAFFIALLGILFGVPLGILCSVNANSIIAFFEKAINVMILFGMNLTGHGEKFSAVSVLNPEYYLQTIPLVLPFKEIFAISVLVLILSVLVSLVPSIKAGREKPVSIFRKF
ncbi:MAG: FtsX-like permease family protein [Treponemataceae bacterium]|nr:FtsX-like permease family protein [Treponemataceae bacterium]